MGRNIKKHEKKIPKRLILHKGQRYPEADFELTQVYNDNGGKPRMWYVNKKDREFRFSFSEVSIITV
jgi:hypothetical protein